MSCMEYIDCENIDDVDKFVNSCIRSEDLWNISVSIWDHNKFYCEKAKKFTIFNVYDKGEVVCFGIVGHYPEGFIDYYDELVIPEFRFSLEEHFQTKKGFENKGYEDILLKEILSDHPRLILLSRPEKIFFYIKHGAFVAFGDGDALLGDKKVYMTFHENPGAKYEDMKVDFGSFIISQNEYENCVAIYNGIVSENEKDDLFENDEYKTDPDSYTREEANKRLYSWHFPKE